MEGGDEGGAVAESEDGDVGERGELDDEDVGGGGDGDAGRVRGALGRADRDSGG